MAFSFNPFTGTFDITSKGVTGPSSSRNNYLAIFDGITGKIIKDFGTAYFDANQNFFVPDTTYSNTTSIGAIFSHTGDNSCAYGVGSRCGANSTSIGYQAISLDNGTAIGFNTNAGSTSTAVGINSSATGANSFAFGGTASNGNDFALGNATIASGGNSLAVAFSADATGFASVAIGSESRGTASNSVAIGRRAYSDHANSCSWGPFGTTSRANQHVWGGNSSTTIPRHFCYGANDSGVTSAIATAVGDLNFYYLNIAAGQTNGGASDIVFNSPSGTGTGLGGAIKFKSSLPGSSGSSRNSWTDSFEVNKMGESISHRAIRKPIETISTNTTLDESHYTVLVDTSGGDVTINLPALSAIPGRIYNIKKKTSDSNKVIINGNGSETIDGSLTAEITVQYESITIQCDGTEWFIL